MKKAIFWTTVISGAVAAYLMYKRGESLGRIATETVRHPIGSMVRELKAAGRAGAYRLNS